jgi:hypothetical protein
MNSLRTEEVIRSPRNQQEKRLNRNTIWLFTCVITARLVTVRKWCFAQNWDDNGDLQVTVSDSVRRHAALLHAELYCPITISC